MGLLADRSHNGQRKGYTSAARERPSNTPGSLTTSGACISPARAYHIHLLIACGFSLEGCFFDLFGRLFLAVRGFLLIQLRQVIPLERLPVAGDDTQAANCLRPP